MCTGAGNRPKRVPELQPLVSAMNSSTGTFETICFVSILAMSPAAVLAVPKGPEASSHDDDGSDVELDADRLFCPASFSNAG